MQNRVSDRDELEMRLGGVESALGKIEDKRERMLTLHREGEITHPELVAHLGTIRRDRDRLLEEQRSLQSRLSMTMATEARTAQLETAVARVGRRLIYLTFEEKFQLVHAFVDRVIVHPDGGTEICTFIPVASGYEPNAMDPGLRPRHVAIKIPSAIGRSNTDPSLRVSAGAKLTVIRRTGISYPEFRTAARTRSRASRTPASGSPTTAKVGMPGLTSTSTSTIEASSPMTAALRTRASTLAPRVSL